MVTGKVTSSGVCFDTIPNRYLPVTLQLHCSYRAVHVLFLRAVLPAMGLSLGNDFFLFATSTCWDVLCNCSILYASNKPQICR